MNRRFLARKKLSRRGNSLALVIGKPMLELLNLDPDGEVEITTDGTSLIVTPVVRADDERLAAALAKGHRRYARMLKRLSEQ